MKWGSMLFSFFWLFFLEILFYLLQAGFTLDVDEGEGLSVVSVEDVRMHAFALWQLVEAVR